MRTSRLAAAAIVFVSASATIASAHRAGATLPVAKLTVEATVGGEPANVELGEDGGITLRAALQPQPQAKRVARIDGATVVATDGRVLASLRPGGYLDVRGFDKPLRLRGCALLDEEGAEYRLTPRGDFSLKRPGQRRFPLPAGVSGDFKRACSTAVLLYWMLPVFVNGPSAERG